MSGPLNTSKLQAYQGVDFADSRVFFTPPTNGSTDVQNLVPMNFTGCTARMMIRLAADPSSTLLQSLTSSPPAGLTFIAGTFSPGPPLPAFNNGIAIALTRAQTLAMNGGVPISGAYYDLLVDQPGSTTILLMSGPFDLLPTVTR